MNPQVVHDPERSRFEAQTPAGEAVLTYVLRDGEVVFDHTLVPPAARGHGLAAALTEEAVRWAAAERLVVHPQCSYVAGWLRGHPGLVAVLELDVR